MLQCNTSKICAEAILHIVNDVLLVKKKSRSETCSAPFHLSLSSKELESGGGSAGLDVSSRQTVPNAGCRGWPIRLGVGLCTAMVFAVLQTHCHEIGMRWCWLF